eukprot:CAMPEP_0168495688 /NCGR_PEP_ID=MMETSP0228-20121227/71870_1 /TAXON_ID=133427 /ORGANISM="Protoceratium reticulatum, Strain CCCM 535 (=CCMP 1889)" /LENGTH=33 /DNA_ID= /DNA_START= /DNA_END= /DNA_ORIENTATION=
MGAAAATVAARAGGVHLAAKAQACRGRAPTGGG